MKTFIKFSMWMAILMIATTVCMAQDNAGNSNELSKRMTTRMKKGNRAFKANEEGRKQSKKIAIKMKSGNMAFKLTENGKEQDANFIFDDNGAHFRIELGDECTIADATTKKAYKLNQANKTYYEEDSFAVFFTLYLFIYPGDSEVVKDYPGYKQLPNRTIAGKNCTVYSYTDKSNTITLGGWGGLVFFKEEPKSTFTVTSFSETIPENSFTIPSDYQLVEKTKE